MRGPRWTGALTPPPVPRATDGAAYRMYRSILGAIACLLASLGVFTALPLVGRLEWGDPTVPERMVIALVPLISPYRAGRDHARALHEAAGLPFFEVFVDTPIEICEQRDPKGLYAQARAGKITGFTGIDDPYEAPVAAELVLPGGEVSPGMAAERVLGLLDGA